MPVFAGIVVDVRALNGMYSTNIPLSMTLFNAHVRPLRDKPLGGFSPLHCCGFFPYHQLNGPHLLLKIYIIR